MNAHRWIAIAAKISGSLGAALMLQPASAIEEIVVYGRRSEFAIEIDRTLLRVDLAEHRQKLANSVRVVLGERLRAQREARDTRVASEDPVPRG